MQKHAILPANFTPKLKKDLFIILSTDRVALLFSQQKTWSKESLQKKDVLTSPLLDPVAHLSKALNYIDS